MNCCGCGVEFKKKSVNQKYCSYRCRKRLMDKQYRIKNGVLPNIEITKICPGCKKEFITNQRNRKFCLESCALNTRAGLRKKRTGRVYRSKKDITCKSCGFNNPMAIEFHHINPLLGNSGGLMPLCSNCHSIYHKLECNRHSKDLTEASVLEVLLRSRIP